MATSLQRYVTQRQAQRARPAPPPPPPARRTTTAQAILPTSRAPARNTMAPPVRAPAVNTMAPPVPRPIQQTVSTPPTGMAQQAPVTAPGQSAPPAAQGQQAPVPPPSLFKQPIAPEFAAPPAAPPPNIYGGMTPGDALGGGLTQRQPQPMPDPYGGMSPGDALGGGLTQQQPDGTRRGQTAQMPNPQMTQLLSVMPADFAAQITPEQLAALTPDQMTEMIVKFSQPQTPNININPVIRSDQTQGDFQSPNIADYMGKGQVYGLGRSNPLSM